MFLEVVTSLFVVWFIYWILMTYQQRRGMPPGPTPLPVIGNLWQMRFGMLDSLDKLRERYGDVYTLSLAIGTVVVINSGNLTRQALVESKDDMAGRASETIFPFNVIFEGKDIIVEDFSPKLLFRRKVFKSAMHIYGMLGVEQAMKRTSTAALNLVKETEKLNCKPFSPINYVRSAMISSLWQWVSSREYPLDHPTVKSLDEFITKAFELGSVGGFFMLIPFAEYFPTKFTRYLKEVENIKEDIFTTELRSHRATYSSSLTRDLTDSFLNAYEKEMAKESSKDIGSAEDVKGLMMDVIAGGVDTSSAYVSWFILYMVLNPDVQNKIHGELDKVIGRSRYPDWNDADDLHYLQATILEVMRHSSAIPVIARTALRDTTIAGYRIPKKTLIFLNNSSINNDPKQWQEPKRFKPDRFLDGNEKFVGWTTFPNFFPFGLGHRRCAGEPLAKITVFTFVSLLLHHFIFSEAEEGAKPTLASVESGVFYPKDFEVCATARF